jgi:hypothetical protein
MNKEKQNGEALIKHLEETNPYPEDVFKEPSKAVWARVASVLQSNGIVPDSVFASWGRHVRNFTINDIKQFYDRQ